jgi:hypothetical protein
MFTADDFDFVRRLRRQLLQAEEKVHSAVGAPVNAGCEKKVVEAHTAAEAQPRTAA